MKLRSFNPPGLAIKRRGHFGASARVLAVLGTATWTLPAANTYLVHNLVSDLPGLADHQDKNLVNAWGNAFSGTSPFWIGNNGSGTATLYDGTGTPIALVVSIPGPTGSSSPGAVTGVLFNSSASSFSVAAGRAASFLFCTEDGTISGWNNSVDGTHAILLIDNSKSGAVYKGCAIGGTPAVPMMYAANFNSGKIDFWDATLKPMPAAFANPAVPAGFAPFNIQNIGGKLYVTYAKQDARKHDDVAGAGNGYVAVFDMSGNLVANLVTQGPLNSPWGLAIAPASFGDFAGALLVGNFGDGKINAFNTTTTALMGTLNDTNGQPISMPGLWSINFGNGGRGGDSATLYFTAGIAGNGDPVESHGLLGSIQPSPFALSTGVVNGATFTADALAPNTWVTVQGGALSATTRAWATADFANNQLPTKLNGVGVTINGEPAYVEFVSPSQLNVLVPADLPAAAVQVQVTNNGLNSPHDCDHAAGHRSGVLYNRRYQRSRKRIYRGRTCRWIRIGPAESGCGTLYHTFQGWRDDRPLRNGYGHHQPGGSKWATLDCAASAVGDTDRHNRRVARAGRVRGSGRPGVVSDQCRDSHRAQLRRSDW